MSDLAAFLNALRGDFGWGGVLALAIVVIVGLLAWNWLKNDSHANTAKVNRSGNSQSTGGSAIATNTINQTFVGYRPVDDTRPKPRIVVSQLKQFQLFEHEIAFFVVGGRAPQQPKPPTPRFYICQVWFKNEPEDASAIAKALTAYITVSRDGVPLFSEARGEWAIANAPTNGAFDETAATLDELLPNGDEAKLVVAQKRTGDRDGYAWLKAADEYTERRHPSFRIPPGRFEVTLRIRGIGIDQSFLFGLNNPGEGQDLVLFKP